MQNGTENITNAYISIKISKYTTETQLASELVSLASLELPGFGYCSDVGVKE